MNKDKTIDQILEELRELGQKSGEKDPLKEKTAKLCAMAQEMGLNIMMSVISPEMQMGATATCTKLPMPKGEGPYETHGHLLCNLLGDILRVYPMLVPAVMEVLKDHANIKLVSEDDFNNTEEDGR